MNPNPQFAPLKAKDVSQLSVVCPFCSNKNADAFAVELSTRTKAADPNTVTSILFTSHLWVTTKTFHGPTRVTKASACPSQQY